MFAAVIDARLVDEGFDWPSWITAASTLAATIIVLVTAWIAIHSLADARRTRDAQLVTDLSRRWDEPMMVESATLTSTYSVREIMGLIERLYAKQPDDPTEEEQQKRKIDLELYSKLFIWPNFLETIGCQHFEGALSARVISRLRGAEIIAAWGTWGEPISRLRELEEDWGIYRTFEELANEMRPLHEKSRIEQA